MRYLSIFIFLFSFLTSCSQQDSSVTKVPEIKHYSYKLGESTVSISQYIYEPVSDFFIIKLHDNEQTAEEAAKLFLQEHGGTLLKIDNAGQRFIEFRKQGRLYTFDPNRIFSKKGINATLKIFNSYSPTIVNEVNRFANYLLKRIPDTAVLIAVHNNTDKHYSIEDYLPSNRLSKDVEKVYKDSGQDADDFVFTTDSTWYKQFVNENINVALQNNSLVKDDGSLSVYYGKRKIPYINVEAEYGHLKEQLQMLRVMLLLFEKNSK